VVSTELNIVINEFVRLFVNRYHHNDKFQL